MSKCALSLPPVGSLLCRSVFKLGCVEKRLYRVLALRRSRWEVKIQEIPSAANPVPRGPAVWVSLLQQEAPFGIFCVEEDAP